MAALKRAISQGSPLRAAHYRQKIRHISYRSMSIKPLIDHQMGI
jgi:hypothetical protein